MKPLGLDNTIDNILGNDIIKFFDNIFDDTLYKNMSYSKRDHDLHNNYSIIIVFIYNK